VGAAAPWALLASIPDPIPLSLVRERFVGYEAPAPLGLVHHGRPAAVLLPVFEEDGDARIVLTRRPETMPSHRGDIAFPGGKIDPAVDVDERAAALREAEEEVGLRPAAVDVVARLPTLGSAVGAFNIVPFVGLVEGRPALQPDSREVDRLFDVALGELLADGVYHEEIWDTPDRGERAIHFYELADETIWGATARILTWFFTRLLVVGAAPDDADGQLS
jgi:8-oxo-dGTP pyrophosphatase MutT (NUDIX family)